MDSNFWVFWGRRCGVGGFVIWCFVLNWTLRYRHGSVITTRFNLSPWFSSTFKYAFSPFSRYLYVYKFLHLSVCVSVCTYIYGSLYTRFRNELEHELCTQSINTNRQYSCIFNVYFMLIDGIVYLYRCLKIGCALIGSLGALYTGVCLVDLGISLFALVAIESSSQSLGRTYAVLLFSSILLDILWFILFTHEIWLVFLTFCLSI